jgi:hypothetical protein
MIAGRMVTTANAGTGRSVATFAIRDSRMTEARLILIRGLPGSGKTTRAKRLAETGRACGLTVRHYEADDYFTAPDGTYSFDPTRIADAHGWCLYLTEQALAAGETVIVSNTFTTRSEMEPYLRVAGSVGLGLGYLILECDGEYKSVHGVPAEIVEAMRARWEPAEWADCRF